MWKKSGNLIWNHFNITVNKLSLKTLHPSGVSGVYHFHVLAFVAQGSSKCDTFRSACHKRITNYHMLFQIQAEVSSGSTGVGGKLQVRVSNMNKYTLFLNLLWHYLICYLPVWLF